MAVCLMISSARIFFSAAFICMLASCPSHPSASPDIGQAPPLLGFPDTSHGNLHERLSRDPLAGETIEHIVIAYGSGMHGFDSVTVDSIGSIEVVLETPARKGRWRSFSAQNLSLASAVLSSRSLQKCRRLSSQYKNDLNDGGQAFLWMKTRNREHKVSCSNVFPPEFSRLWEDIRHAIQETKAEKWKESRGAPFAVYQSVARQRAMMKTAAAQDVSGP
jgi:hypothetical protein